MPRSGWDNRTFFVGTDKVARLPSASAYEAQVNRGQRWLPYLRPRLPLDVPLPLALGQPGEGYPWKWSIYGWIDGDTAATTAAIDATRFAQDLAAFMNAMHAVPGDGGPEPGQENFYRGGDLAVYDAQLRRAVGALGDQIDGPAAIATWEAALSSRWSGRPVWVHGDVALGNLLLRNGRLAAVIDFGQVCVGDPACDLAIAWTFFRGRDRETFRQRLTVAQEAWQRGRAWALWKAAIVAAGTSQTNAVEAQAAWATLSEVLDSAH